MSQPEWRARAAAVDDGGQVPTAGWIVGTSCWLIPVFFTGGGFTWLGFLIIGLMLVRPTWLVSAGVYAVWAIASIAIADDQARIVTSALLTSTGIIHGLIANRRLLLTIWGRLERGEQWWGQGGPDPTRRRAPTRRAAPRPRGRRGRSSARGRSTAGRGRHLPRRLPRRAGTRRCTAPSATRSPPVRLAAHESRRRSRCCRRRGSRRCHHECRREHCHGGGVPHPRRFHEKARRSRRRGTPRALPVRVGAGVCRRPRAATPRTGSPARSPHLLTTTPVVIRSSRRPLTRRRRFRMMWSLGESNS